MADVVLSHLSERSVLHDPSKRDLQPFEVAGRERLATCSGVTWFAGYHLAMVNLHGQTLRVYRFHPAGDGGTPRARLEFLHERAEGIAYPEDVAVTPDGKLMAVTHTMTSELGVSLHAIGGDSLAPGPGETIRRGTARGAFSRRDVLPGWAARSVVSMESPSWPRTCLLENRYAPLKPKAFAFSDDGRFAVVALAPNAQAVGMGPPACRDAGCIASMRPMASSKPVPLPNWNGKILRCRRSACLSPARASRTASW